MIGRVNPDVGVLMRYADVLKREHSETINVHSHRRTCITILQSAGRAGMRHYAARNIAEGTQYQITRALV